MCELGKIAPLDVIIGLQKHLAKPGFPNWVILKVELVEAMKGIRMRVHVQRVYGEIVRREIQ
jgi:hypothetical protein